MKYLVLLFAVALVVVSQINCANSNGTKNENEIRDYDVNQPLVGKVDGKDFTFVSGKAVVNQFKENEWRISLWGEQVTDPCNRFGSGIDEIIFSIPQVVGTVKLDFNHSVTFYAYHEGANLNRAGIQGQITISKIEDGKISGFLSATYDDSNSAAGSFQIPLCPSR